MPQADGPKVPLRRDEDSEAREKAEVTARQSRLPRRIPVGARVVVRTAEGVDPDDGRMKYRDFIGHVHHWDGNELDLLRDPAANGSRAAQRLWIEAGRIVRIKAIPERR